ncbi:MAG: cytochrome c biogenesis protein ResB [Acidobacteria bacterium]|nr:cytochrome c biogenesis protein ResB [Acidobacteriota bacterium]
MRSPLPDAAHVSRPVQSPLSAARAFGRWLLRMRTAIFLLLALAAGSAVGSLMPQRPVDPAAVDGWIARHRALAPLAERFGLFDVFGAWWFMAIYLLLVVSLTGCVVPRLRAFARAVRSRPRARASFDGLPLRRAIAVPLVAVSAGDPVLEAAARALRRRRFRVARAGAQVAAEKGYLREGGSLLFHSALLALLLGATIGRGFGFTAQVAVVEGGGFTDTHVAYDSIREGRFFGERHRGFRVALEAFDVRWHSDGVPADFVSRVRVLEGDRVVRRAAIRVNHPLAYRGVRVYQIAWGWAPRVRVTQRGRVLADGEVVFLDDRATGAFRGVVKAPSAAPAQLGLEMWLYNDLGIARGRVPFNRSPQARRPVLLYQEHRGDLRLDRPQSVYQLDPVGLVPGGAGTVPLGDTAVLGDGIEVSFPGLKQYSVFQVASDPGTPVALAAAVLALAGLLAALYTSRRRVWVRAEPGGDSIRLDVAGLAFQRKAAFEEEFEGLVRDLRERLGGAVLARPGDPPGAPDPTVRPAGVRGR